MKFRVMSFELRVLIVRRVPQLCKSTLLIERNLSHRDKREKENRPREPVPIISGG
jgi:hypothetical protein